MSTSNLSSRFDRFRQQVQDIERIFCILHVGMGEFYGNFHEDPIQFKWPGTDTNWHEPLALVEVMNLGRAVAGKNVLHTCFAMAYAVDAYLLDLCKLLPEYASTNDVSWWSPDMIETVSRVPINALQNALTVSKLYRMRDVAFKRSVYAPGDDVNFQEVLAMPALLLKFAEEFERAFLEANPKIKL